MQEQLKTAPYDLPEIMASIIITATECPEFGDITLDDFYDFVGIPYEDRTDFGSAALYSQTIENLRGIKE